jgi:hypothetical protein
VTLGGVGLVVHFWEAIRETLATIVWFVILAGGAR